MKNESNNLYTKWQAITEEEVKEFLKPENIDRLNKRSFAGFDIIDSIDGRPNQEIEVSLIKITQAGEYSQHFHQNSDAYFIITFGRAIFLSDHQKKEIKKGDRIIVPRGMPHGFTVEEGNIFEFISFQSPPIHDKDSGEEDFHLF